MSQSCFWILFIARIFWSFIKIFPYMYGNLESQMYLKTIWLSSFQLSVSILILLKIVKFWFVFPQVWVWFHLHPFWIQMFFHQIFLCPMEWMRVHREWRQSPRTLVTQSEIGLICGKNILLLLWISSFISVAYDT